MAQVKNPFNGQLNSNEIFSAIFNMIISQDVRDPKLASNYSKLLGIFKTDGSMFGDTKLFYDIDVLSTRPWGADSEAANLLNINRPADPECQAITLDTFRQCDITVDNYLSKRAWSTEGAFTQFNAIVVKMLSKAKEVHEVTLFNSYVGTVETNATTAEVEVDLAGISATGEEKNRLGAQLIAESIADLTDDMCDYSRDYNEYGFLRAYQPEDLIVVWNNKYVNKITKVDLPTIYHDTKVFGEFAYKLPARYFGAVSAAPTAGDRSLVEKMVGTTNYLPGDLIKTADLTSFVAGETYTPDDTIICKVMSKEAIKFMDAFETATEFFNPRSLTQNHYLTFGYAAPDYLRGEAIVVVKEKPQA